MAIFGPKIWVNPFGKMSIFRVFELLVFVVQRDVFSFQNIVKDIFLAYIFLKIKVGKMAIFGLKIWVNPFGKMSIFRVYELVVFVVQRDVFSFQNIVKDIFLAYISLKIKLEKWPFLDQNHGLTPLEKCQFFDFFNLLFLQSRKTIFVLEYRKRHFSGLHCLNKKVGKMAIFGPNPWLNPFGKMSIFRVFKRFVFIVQKGVFSFQNIVKDIFLGYIS